MLPRTYLPNMDFETAREMALDMPGTAEREHHGRPSYSVKKKIYMTLWLDEGRTVLKLTPLQQAEFSGEYPDAFAPVPNKWGQHGWTNVFMDYCNARDSFTRLSRAVRDLFTPVRSVPRSCSKQCCLR